MPFTFTPTGNEHADGFLARAAAHLDTLPLADRAGWLAVKQGEIARWQLSAAMNAFDASQIINTLGRWEAQAEAGAKVAA